MSLPGIFSTVFVGALVLAMPVYAVDTGVLPGSHGTAVSEPSGITSPADSGFEQSGEPAQGRPQHEASRIGSRSRRTPLATTSGSPPPSGRRAWP